MPSHELTAVSVCASAFQIQQGGLPLRAGVGLKPEYFRTIVDTWPDLGFFEIHAENYMVAGGPFHHYLTTIRERYPLSIHSVGLSIGGEQAPDPEHLRRLRNLLDRYQPEAFSEHLAWSNNGQFFLNDLLPVPYCVLTLTRICNHIDQIQTQLGRRMLLENPATYVEFAASTFEEPDFICEVIRRTGCGLLLDVNNIYVSCFNHHRHATGYLRALPLHATGEIHLAGFARDVDPTGDCLLIDSHDCPVAPAVWQLYDQALELTGPQPSLLERDNDLPAFEVLLEESQQAERRLTRAATAEKPIQ